MENKIAHLQMIQGIINRMSSSSFIFKGFAVTIITGLTLQLENNCLFFVPIVLTFIFCFIDNYYLMLERSFRKLYDEVSKKSESQINFSMDISNYKKKKDFLKTLTRPIIWFYYGTILLLIILWRCYNGA